MRIPPDFGDVGEQRIRPEATSEAVMVPTPHGIFSIRAWSFPDGHEILTATAADASGNIIDSENPEPLVRLHSECLTGDVFGSFRCDCGPQLAQGLETIAKVGGTLMYIKGHEGRGIGLVHKIRAYALQDQGVDTVDANLALGFEPDPRAYAQAAYVLRDLGITTLRLMTNNPAKVEALAALGIEVSSIEPDEIGPRPENARYLATKRDRMHHRLELLTNEGPEQADVNHDDNNSPNVADGTKETS